MRMLQVAKRTQLPESPAKVPANFAVGQTSHRSQNSTFFFQIGVLDLAIIQRK